MQSFRAGIVGCGNIGGRYDERGKINGIYTHAGMYKHVKGLELVCAADTDTKRLDEFGKYWKVKHLYNDYKVMFRNEKLDIISIATPDETHYEIILNSLKNNPPRLIFTEKPLANSIEQAIEVYRKCKEKDVDLVVDYVRRWDENHQRVKKFIEQGKLGRIQATVVYYVRGLLHNGCQMINLIQFFFGKIIKVQVVGESDMGSLDGDPSLNMLLTLEDGVQVYMIAVDQKGYGFSIFEMDIFGLEGRLCLCEGGQSIELYKADSDRQFPNFKNLVKANSPWEKSTYGNAMIRAGNEFVSFLIGESKWLNNGVLDAIDDLCVIESALESARNNNIQTVIKMV